MADGELTQEEISALLSSYSSDGSSALDGSGGAGGSRSGRPSGVSGGGKPLKVYDFMRPDKFSREQLRTLQLVHETFARHLATSLSAQVRSLVRIDVDSCTQCVYEEFVGALAPPTCLYVVSAPPLAGRIIVELNTNLSLSIVNRLLGGPWRNSFRTRDLTDIEYSIMKTVLGRGLEGLSMAWSAIAPLKPELVGYESDPQFAQILAPHDPVCLISLSIHMGGFVQDMSLCISYAALQPVLGKLNPQQWLMDPDRHGGPEPRGRRIGLDEATLPLTVELGRATATMKELLELEVGDVIRLTARKDGPLTVSIGELPKFTALPGTAGSKSAVKIVSVLPIPRGGDDRTPGSHLG